MLPEITLHIGLGTFSPVDVEDLSKHKMDSEELIINDTSAEIINNAIKNKKRICAVGTTVMRGLESSVSSFGTLNSYNGWTHKFIYPPHDFSIANSMITNFHTPKSTLIMMVSAFGGVDFVLKAYKEAIYKDGIPATMFYVDDINTEYKKLLDKGVQFKSKPAEMGSVKIAVFDDTCGNYISLCEKLS